MKLKNSNCDETQKLKWWQNSNCDQAFFFFYKTQIVTKFRLWQNSKCDTTQILTKLKNSNCDKTQKLKLDKTQKLKLWPNLNDKSQFMTKDIIKGYFSKNILTPWQPMRCSLVSLLSEVTEACGSTKMSFITSWPYLDDQLKAFRVGVILIILNFEVTFRHCQIALGFWMHI